MATGNSFAAPHIAGLAALIRGRRPDASPFEVKTILAATANQPGDLSRTDCGARPRGIPGQAGLAGVTAAPRWSASRRGASSGPAVTSSRNSGPSSASRRTGGRRDGRAAGGPGQQAELAECVIQPSSRSRCGPVSPGWAAWLTSTVPSRIT